MKRMSRQDLDKLVALMRALEFSQDDMFRMYFMTFDDPPFASSFMSTCSKNSNKVNEYLEMLSKDIESSETYPVYRAFRQTASYTPRQREQGVLERFSKTPKLKIRLKG